MKLSETPITKENFHISSITPWSQCELPEREPDLILGEGFDRSRFWFEGDLIVRDSNHWGDVGACYWPVERLKFNSRIKFAKGDDPRSKSVKTYEDGCEVRITCAAFLADFKWKTL